MAFGNMAKAASSKAKKERVAMEMTQKTPYTITADMVTLIDSKAENAMKVYAAQVGDVTVLCWARRDGQFTIQGVCW